MEAPGVSTSTRHYREPSWLTKHVFNNAVAGLTLIGVSVLGSRVLEVNGRKTGTPHRTPVNLLKVGKDSYLVAARGETQWVRNVRAAHGRLQLLLGRRRTHHRAVELSDAAKIPILRAYLRRWKAEVGVFFDGVGPDSPDQEIAAVAGQHPVFHLIDR